MRKKLNYSDLVSLPHFDKLNLYFLESQTLKQKCECPEQLFQSKIPNLVNCVLTSQVVKPLVVESRLQKIQIAVG